MNDEKGSNDPAVLSCWKDIANYLGKGVRTVQRWEREFDLPVRRPDGIHHKSAVIANARDLDAWLDSRWSGRNGKHRNGHAGPDGDATESVVLIRRARNLRAAHSILIEETLLAMDSLVQTCNDLELTKRETVFPPPPRIFDLAI